MRNVIISLFTFVFLAAWASVQAGTDNGEPSISADSAIRVALDWLGLDQNDSLSSFKIGSDPVLMRMTYDEPEPVVKEDLEGRLVWRVTLDRVILTIEHARPPRNETSPHNARVYVDAKSGVMIKVIFSVGPQRMSEDNPSRELVRERRRTPLSGARVVPNKPKLPFAATLRERYRKSAEQKIRRLPDGTGTGGNHPLNNRRVTVYPLVFYWPPEQERQLLLPEDSVPVWLMILGNWDASAGVYERNGDLRRWSPSIEYIVLDPTTDRSRVAVKVSYTDEPVPQKPRRKAE